MAVAQNMSFTHMYVRQDMGEGKATTTPKAGNTLSQIIKSCALVKNNTITE